MNRKIKLVDEDGIELAQGFHSKQFHKHCKGCGELYLGVKRSKICFSCTQERTRKNALKNKKKRYCWGCKEVLGRYKQKYCSDECQRKYSGR